MHSLPHPETFEDFLMDEYKKDITNLQKDTVGN